MTITPAEAAKAFGMNEKQVQSYLASISERDDFLEWEEANDGSDWIIHAVPVPFGAPLYEDLQYADDPEFDNQCWLLPGGGVVYVSEPDCVVALERTPGRFVQVTP